MPKPPNPFLFDKINFIVNYALLGCTPKRSLFVEFAQEPANDLAHLILVPDPVDIGQAIFEPKKERRRRAGRRGRKRKRRINFPDTSDMIGQRVRAVLNPFDAFKLTPVRYVFPLVQAYEGIAFTIALVDGFADIFYEGLLGVITVDPTNCRDLDRVVRRAENFPVVGGTGPNIDTIALTDLVQEIGFTSGNGFATNPTKKFIVTFVATLRARGIEGEKTCELALGPQANTIRYRSNTSGAQPGETFTLQVSGEFEAMENVVWGLGDRDGFFTVLSAEVICYSVAELPFWQ